MQEIPLGRKMVFITMPIEALLEVISGRITLKLPPEVPEDAKYLYTYVDEEKQVLQIAVTHESFEPKLFDAHITEHRVLLGVITEKDGTPEGSQGESNAGAGDIDRLV